MEVAVRTQPDAWLDTPAVVRDRPMERPLEPSRLGDHLDRLYRAAWALSGSREDAEDLVQETYARVLGRPRLLRNEDDLGYLLRALRNTFLNQKRAEGRRLRPDPLPEQLELVADPHARGPEAALEPASSTRRSPRSQMTSATSSSQSTSPAFPTRGRTRAAHPQGHSHEPPVPSSPAGGAPNRGRLSLSRRWSPTSTFSLDATDAVGLLARDAEGRGVSRGPGPGGDLSALRCTSPPGRGRRRCCAAMPGSSARAQDGGSPRASIRGPPKRHQGTRPFLNQSRTASRRPSCGHRVQILALT